MPLVGFRPGSRASEVHFWLVEHPGYHSPQTVGDALHLNTHQAAVTLNALLKRSLVERRDKQYAAAGAGYNGPYDADPDPDSDPNDADAAGAAAH